MILTATPHEQLPVVAQVRADVYPATVAYSFADNPFPKSRVVVTADEIFVFVDGRATPNLYYRGRLEDVGGTHAVLVATTDDGQITVTRAQGCGCGSRLKSFRPFARMVRMATPR